MTSPAEGYVPGTIWFGPDTDIEQHRYFSYGAYWEEVAQIENHRRWVRERTAEADGAAGPLAVELRLRAERTQVEYARFVESIPLAAKAYDSLCDLHVVIEGYGGPYQYQPCGPHLAARDGQW